MEDERSRRGTKADHSNALLRFVVPSLVAHRKPKSTPAPVIAWVNA